MEILAVLGAAVLAAVATLIASLLQRAGALIVAAMQHMSGGSQQRSAGLATLQVLRGRYAKRRHFVSRWTWRSYAPAVGQHLFRQTIYVLHHGSQRYYAHEIENVITMITWLRDDEHLAFSDRGQQARLLVALQQYVTPGKTASEKDDQTRVDASVDALAAVAGSIWPGKFQVYAN